MRSDMLQPMVVLVGWTLAMLAMLSFDAVLAVVSLANGADRRVRRPSPNAVRSSSIPA